MNNSPTDLFLNKVGSPPFKLCEIRIQLWSSGIVHHVLPYTDSGSSPCSIAYLTDCQLFTEK